MIAERDVSRRTFLQVVSGVGASFVLGSFSMACSKVGGDITVGAAEKRSVKGKAGASFVPNGYLKIDPDGTVTVTVFRSEMGQGVRTALALLVAEDLDADWRLIKVTQAPGADVPVPGQGTGGSSSVISSYSDMRRVGASARLMLIDGAAKQWNVDPATCRTETGKVIHDASNRSAGYGELVGTAITVPIPDEASVKLKPASEFKILGKGTPRIDNPDIVRGKALYGLDVKVPGMKYAVIARPPNIGAHMKSFDDSEAMKTPGVLQVFEAGNGVAVIADNTWASIKGREALKIDWEDGPNLDVSSETLRKALVAGVVDHKEMPQGAKVVEATLDLPFIAHATMEPMNAVADVRTDGCDVWTGTQVPDSAQRQVARAVKMSPDQVRVNVCLLGGGFGRRLFTEFIEEAALLSQKAKCPIKLLWTREDDMRNDHYRSMSHHSFKGAVDASGVPVGWSHQAIRTEGGQSGPEFRRAGIPYKIDGAGFRVSGVPSPVSTGPWRSVEHTQFDVANECFIDELAHAAGKDPFEFRRDFMQNPRLKKVLETAAEKASWGSPLTKGCGRGIACFAGYGSYAAHVIEVKVSGDQIKVLKVFAVIDPGLAVNTTGIGSVVQSGCSDGLSTALRAEITVEKGAIVQGSWDGYQWMTLDAMPPVDITIIQGTDSPGGLGEPVYPSVAPALANAVFAATGKRVRKFPVKVSELV